MQERCYEFDVDLRTLPMPSTIKTPKDNERMTIFVGSWDVTIATAIGDMAVVFDITEQDDVIHGIARSAAEAVNFLDAVADGNRLTWTQVVTTPMRLTLKFEVTVDGDTMTGTSKASFLPTSKVSGTRTSAR